MPVKIRKQSAPKTQVLVILALLSREMSTRFGRYSLGAFWMVFEPLMSVVIMGVIMAPFTGRTSGAVPYAFFMLCGFMMLRTLTGTMAVGSNTVQSNKDLFVYRQVQPLDPFIARFVFEFLTSVISFALFCFIGMWIGIELSGHNLITLLACFIATWITGCGLGLILGVHSMRIVELNKIQQFIQRPLLFTSCIFFSLDSMPYEARKALLWNPLVHTVELSRNALFPVYRISDELNLTYPFVFASITLMLGLAAYNNNRNFLIQR